MYNLVLPSSLDPPSPKMLCTKLMDLKLLRARHGQLIAFQLVPALRLQFCMNESGHFLLNSLLLYPPDALACWLAFSFKKKLAVSPGYHRSKGSRNS